MSNNCFDSFGYGCRLFEAGEVIFSIDPCFSILIDNQMAEIMGLSAVPEEPLSFKEAREDEKGKITVFFSVQRSRGDWEVYGRTVSQEVFSDFVRYIRPILEGKERSKTVIQAAVWQSYKNDRKVFLHLDKKMMARLMEREVVCLVHNEIMYKIHHNQVRALTSGDGEVIDVWGYDYGDGGKDFYVVILFDGEGTDDIEMKEFLWELY